MGEKLTDFGEEMKELLTDFGEEMKELIKKGVEEAFEKAMEAVRKSLAEWAMESRSTSHLPNEDKGEESDKVEESTHSKETYSDVTKLLPEMPALQVFDENTERRFVQKAPSSISQGTNPIICPPNPYCNAFKTHCKMVMIYKLHENEYGKFSGMSDVGGGYDDLGNGIGLGGSCQLGMGFRVGYRVSGSGGGPRGSYGGHAWYDDEGQVGGCNQVYEGLNVGAVNVDSTYNAIWCAVEYFESSGAILSMLLQHISQDVPHLGRTVFHHAILCGNARAVEVLLSCSANAEFPVKTTERTEFLPLHLAAKLGSTNIMQQLINAGCNLDSKSEAGETAIMNCARYKRVECLKLLALAGADFGLLSSDGQWVRSIAESMQWTNEFQQAVLEVIQAEKVPHSSNIDVFFPLIYVIQTNDTTALRKLLEKPVIDLDQQDKNGFSAAMVAATGGHVEAFRLLVYVGADLMLLNKNGETAVSLSEDICNRDEFGKVILEYAIGKGNQCSSGFHALHRAARQGDIDSAGMLMVRGYDINIPDSDGYTPLMLAAKEGHGAIYQNSREYLNYEGKDLVVSVPNADVPLPIYRSAKVFSSEATYTFRMNKAGWHWIRLHFFPVSGNGANLQQSKFIVISDSLVLLHEFSVGNEPEWVMKEYLVNVTNQQLSIKFKPAKDSTAFINAIEVVSAPDMLISDVGNSLVPVAQTSGLSRNSYQTVYRLNVGGPKVESQSDTLGRTWTEDKQHLKPENAGRNVSVEPKVIVYHDGNSPLIAPPSVYASAMEMGDANTVGPNFNVTWSLDIDTSYSYLVRLHFTDIVSKSLNDRYFNVYVGGKKAISGLHLSTVAGDLASAYYRDFVVSSSMGVSSPLKVQISPMNEAAGTKNALLNGLEVLKINNSVNSLDGEFGAVKAGVVSPSTLRTRSLFGSGVLLWTGPSQLGY